LYLIIFIAHAQKKSIEDALREGLWKVSQDGSVVDLSRQGINSWKGVELLKPWFPNILELNLSHNQLTSVPLCVRSLESDIMSLAFSPHIGNMIQLNLEYNNIEKVEQTLDSWLNRQVSYLYLAGNPMSAEEKRRLKFDVMQGSFRVSFKSTESRTPNQNSNVGANVVSSSSSSSSNS